VVGGVALGLIGDLVARVGALDGALALVEDLLGLLEERLDLLDERALVAVIFLLGVKVLDVLNK
jgi:hypothetical protein